MKICYFAETYRPIISGTSISLQNLTNELSRRSIEFRIVTASYPNSEENWNVIHYSSLPLPGRFDFRLGIPNSSKLLPIIRQFSPEIIHTQQPFGLGRVAIKIARQLGIPVFGTIHTQYDHDSYLHYLAPLPKSTARLVMRNIVRGFCNNCDGITTPASGMSSHLKELQVQTPIYTIPNGVNLNFITKAQSLAKISQSNLTNKNAKSLIFVGRMTKEKNLPFLLDSFRLILKKHSTARLILIGDGPEQNNLKVYASRLGISDHIQFCGWVAYENLSDYYLSADIFVMPSTSEVDPLCLKEALVTGTPVVGVDTYSARQILENGKDSILTPPNPDEFSNAVVSLLETPGMLQKMSVSAIANSTKFTIEHQVDQLLEVYSAHIQ
jgi:1,2-diacylglycerol 3-alpha-glucosyltransferase